jgi:thiamine-phosphate pyrophosphorylase
VVRDVPFVVNDRVDVALLVQADAVHLGQDDLELADARRIADGLGRKLLVGVSTHDLAQASAAARAGADYLGFGPVFATTTKENPDPVRGLAALAEAVRAAAPVPVVAIGGVTMANAALVARAGAAAACAIGAVNSAADPEAAARAIAAAFAS